VTTKLLLACDGCGVKATSEKWLSRSFHGVNGKSYGFGHWKTTKPEDIAPEGWVILDPYTGCTYCPTCWAEIEREPTEADQGLIPIPDGYAEQ